MYNLFCDVETTGFHAFNNSVIEIAAIVDDGKGKELGRFEERMKVQELIDYEWEESKHYAIHGIRQDELINEYQAVAKNFLRFLYDFNSHMNFICHSGKFYDYKMIEGWLGKCELNGYFNGMIRRPIDPMNDAPRYEEQFYMEDTVKIAKMNGRTKNKLNILCEEFGIELDHHRAMSDTEATKKLYYKLKEEQQELVMF